MAQTYRPLNFIAHAEFPHDYPDDYCKSLPKFNGTNAISAEEHVEVFEVSINNIKVEHEDLKMKLFVQSLESEAS